MKLSVDEFRKWDNKRVTLLGMSGVGKTRISNLLRNEDWFHYSADYRIGTHYLDEPILDNIKKLAMQVPFLHDLLRADSIHITNNISVDNLKPVSSFLGMVGNPEEGGISLREFRHRQTLHHEAEIAAMYDVPEFIRKSTEIYGYRHFINDAGGSLCELEDEYVMDLLSMHTLIIYIRASREDEEKVIRRAEAAPKPLYYRPDFLEEQLDVYMREQNLPYAAMINPGEFVRWVFPRLYRARKPRYEAIAREYGYTISTEELGAVSDETDFIALLEQSIARAG